MTSRAIRVGVVASCVLGAIYLVWRGVFTLNAEAPILSVALLLVEIHAYFGFLLFVQATWRIDAVSPPKPLTGPSPLSVAVLIPTYNEDFEILLPTVACAVALSPAHQTWVLDDGRRAWVEEMATALGARYLTRPDNEHAKAGNLNHALNHIDTDLVAIFDADHVPHHQFLLKTIGYFERDPELALVQTPQDFYNLDSFGHEGEWLEEGLFYRVIQPGKNGVDAAFWCGTNAVLRTEALRGVGGVAVESVTEDAHTTLRLISAGWRTVYHNEVLARGLSPANFTEFDTQRERWGTGAMQVLRQEWFLLRPKLSVRQRFAFIFTFAGWFDSWRTLAMQLLPMFVLLTGRQPIDAPLGMLIAAFAVLTTIQQVTLSGLGRGRYNPVLGAVFELLRLRAALTATVGLFIPSGVAFRVTPKGRSGDGRHRTDAPLLLRTLFWANVMIVSWALLTLLGFTIAAYRSPGTAIVAVIIAAINLGLTHVAIRRIGDERFASDRRGSYRAEGRMSVLVDGRPAILRSFGLNGGRMEIDGPRPTSLDRGSVELRIGRHVESFEFEVIRIDVQGGTTLLAFRWVSGQVQQLGLLAQAVMAYRLGPEYSPDAKPARRWINSASGKGRAGRRLAEQSD